MSKNNLSIAGKIVVITGGCGQLGQQWMEALHAAGARVGLVDRDLMARLPDGVLQAKALVHYRSEMDDVLEWTLDRFGQPPHALICAAAIDAKPGAREGVASPFTDPLEDFERVMSVNVAGVRNCIQVFGKAMAAEGRGSIVAVSSIYGMRSPDQRRYEPIRQAGNPYYKPDAYSASKAALYGLTRWWATYLAPFGVRVNCVTFGSMDRPDYQEGFRAAFEHDVPLSRFARPGEFDGVLQWLISDGSSYVTGENIPVTGGYLAW